MFPMSQRFFLQSLIAVILRVMIAAYTIVWILLITPILVLFSIYYLWVFIIGLKETRWIEGVTSSPMISHLGETITGVRTIRAYRVEE